MESVGPVSFASHRVEVLYEYFKAMLFNEYTDAFTKRIVIVPSPLVRSWLEVRLANDPEVEVSIGIEWYLLASFMDQFPYLLSSSVIKRIPRYIELCVRIEEILRYEPLPDELKEYLGEVKKNSSLGKEQRITHLADYLARLFMLYGQYPKGVVKQGALSGWQGTIWKRVYAEERVWDASFLESISKGKCSAKNVFIHLFPVSYLTRIQHEMLSIFSQFYPVYYYQFSPSPHYWGDLRSVRERLGEEEFFEENSHPLLSSWGKLGRSFLRLCAENVTCVAESFETYPEKHSLLSKCQDSILSLEKAGYEEIIEECPSIQIHCVPTCRREVQVVLDLIKRLIKERGFAPEDFLVLSPDVQKYVSLIECVVGEEADPLPYQVLDLGKEQSNPLVRSLVNMCELAKSRWDLSSVLRLFNQQEFREWVSSLGVVWGMDEAHRKECFAKDYGVELELTGEEQWSWEFGFKRLLEEGKEGKKWIDLLRSLYNDLSPLRENEQRSLGDWLKYIEGVFYRYFSIEEDSESFEELEKGLADFLFSIEHVKELFFPFSTFEYHLRHFFSKSLTNISSYLPGAIHFCSLFPMRSIPAKVVMIMGMDEETFPRKEIYFALNLLKEAEEKEYCPTQQEYDRYLFLETLLSARDYLFITQTNNFRGGKCYATPSLVVQELLHYLDETYSINGGKPSEKLLFNHPSHAYSPLYFQEGSPFTSYSSRRYALASLSLNKEPVDTLQDERSFIIREVPEEGVSYINVSDLLQVVRTPLKVYCNHSLGIWRERLRTQEEVYSLSYKDFWFLRHELFSFTPEKVLERWKTRGRWPLGALGQTAWELLKQHSREINKGLEALDIAKGEMKELILSNQFTEPTFFEEKKLGHPPLVIGNRSIQGKIGWVTTKGLLLDKRSELREHLLAWPLALLFNQLNLSNMDNSLLFLKSGHTKTIESTQNDLRSLTDYYHLCKHAPSPLYPHWVKGFYCRDASILEKKPPSIYKEEYFDWAFDEGVVSSSQKLLEEWHPHCYRVFNGFVTTWHPEWKNETI